MQAVLFLLAAIVATAVQASPTPGTCASLNPCQQGATCTDTAYGPACSCPGGFSGNGLSTPCLDINECAIGTHLCKMTATCVNTEGSYYCSCDFGFDMDGSSNCVMQTTVISGFVYSSMNKSNFFPPTAVQLSTPRRNEKGDLIAQANTDVNGQYTFDVAYGRRYMTCANVFGFEACVTHTVPARDFIESIENDSNFARKRRLTNLALLNIPVPGQLARDEWEIHTIWAMDSSTYHCDWDSTVFSDINGGCLAAYKDPYNAGLCFNGGTRSVIVAQDSNCQFDSFGFEAIRIKEPGVKTYKHMVYGHQATSSFSSLAFSQAQVNVYKKGILGNVLYATMLLADVIPGNFNYRFWHTFSIYINTPANAFVGTGTITYNNLISCSPLETTGSNAPLNFENGPRRC